MGYVEVALGILKVIEDLKTQYANAKAAAAQSGEMTAEEEAEFKAREENAFAAPEWQPDTPAARKRKSSQKAKKSRTIRE